jgi:hypothetical protein
VCFYSVCSELPFDRLIPVQLVLRTVSRIKKQRETKGSTNDCGAIDREINCDFRIILCFDLEYRNLMAAQIKTVTGAKKIEFYFRCCLLAVISVCEIHKITLIKVYQ